MDSFVNKIDRIIKVQRRLPHLMATEGVNFVKERFVRKNWVDARREPWKKRKRKDRGSLMIRTGRGKRSIRKMRVGGNYAIIGTDVEYLKPHNEGAEIDTTQKVKQHTRRGHRGRAGRSTVRAHTRKMKFTMPRRQFIGDSAVLGRRIERLVARQINNAMRRP